MSEQKREKIQEEQLLDYVPKGAIFEHYKGKKYKIIGIARHSETLKLCVIYEALYDSLEFGSGSIWVRPLEMFVETVEIEGRQMPRFRLISEG